MCLAQGPQRSDAGEARTRGPSVLSQALYHWATALPQPPKSHPWSMTQAAKWKSRLICFISFICEKIHKVWCKNLWNWFCNWNLMIFIDIWPFGPSPGPQGGGGKKCAVARPIHVSNFRTKFGWISSNGLGGDSLTDRRRRLQYPRFLKSVEIIKNLLKPWSQHLRKAV